MAFRRSLAALLTVMLAVPSCSTVLVVDDDGSEDAPPGGADPVEDEPGAPKPTCTADPADVVNVQAIASASFVEGRLHVEGSIAGAHDYAILDLVDRGVARLVERRPDLIGGASWTMFGAQVPHRFYARLRGTTLDVLKGSEDSAHLAAQSDLGVSLVAGAEAIAVSDGGIYLCVDTGGPMPLLHRFDMVDLMYPQAAGASEICDLYGGGRAEASGNLWVNTGEADVFFLRIGSDVSEGHGWNPDGVHAYGGLTAVETDGHVVAATLENEAYVFLYYTNAAEQFVVYSSFGGGEKKLLAVENGRAIVALPDPEGARIVSFELDPPPAWEEAVPRGDLDALIRGVEGIAALEMPAHDGNWGVLSDGTKLFALSLGGASVNDPLLVVREGASLECKQ